MCVYLYIYKYIYAHAGVDTGICGGRTYLSQSLSTLFVVFFFLKTMSQYLDLFNSAIPKDPPASTTPCHTSFLHGC